MRTCSSEDVAPGDTSRFSGTKSRASVRGGLRLCSASNAPPPYAGERGPEGEHEGGEGRVLAHDEDSPCSHEESSYEGAYDHSSDEGILFNLSLSELHT